VVGYVFWRGGLGKPCETERNIQTKITPRQAASQSRTNAKTGTMGIFAAAAFGVALRTGTAAKIVPNRAISARLPWNRP
jgi:hypothetical protein